MTPTLAGRLQTRWTMLATVGVVWTIAAGPFLPGAADATTVFRTGLTALVLVAVVGTVWELLYHLLQQLRWEKDWPILFGLLLGIPEGIVAYRLLATGSFGVGDPGPATFAWLFATTWLVIWLVTNGPIRILFPRWRFNGGRFV